MRTLEDKAVIVTGAGAGLGRAYALAAAAAGARVVINDVDAVAAATTVADIEQSGGRAVDVVGSVADWGLARSLTETSLSHFGRLDGLVNNAGIARHNSSWQEQESDLRAVADVNILGSQFAARHALEAMVDAGRGGAVVNVISGARLGIVGMSSYGASKGAVAAMTLNWAAEVQPFGIRVNAISPLADTAMAALDTRSDTPRLPDPARVAPLVIALLDDRLGSLTGALLRFVGTHVGVYRDELSALFDRDEGWDASALVAALAASGLE